MGLDLCCCQCVFVDGYFVDRAFPPGDSLEIGAHSANQEIELAVPYKISKWAGDQFAIQVVYVLSGSTIKGRDEVRPAAVGNVAHRSKVPDILVVLANIGLIRAVWVCFEKDSLVCRSVIGGNDGTRHRVVRQQRPGFQREIAVIQSSGIGDVAETLRAIKADGGVSSAMRNHAGRPQSNSGTDIGA